MIKKYLARDVSSFALMIKKNYIYVDKTEQIYNLYRERDRYHFLARPRKFGKSLLISTLYQLFTGNRELFKGLWIDSSDFEFSQHPVIHLDFSTLQHESEQALRASLSARLYTIAQEYQVHIEPLVEIKDLLSELIPKLAEINQVVLLVDDYDHPLLSYIPHNPALVRANLKILTEFYDAIKGYDAHFQAIFVTGVTKPPKGTISGFNIYHDISEDKEFSDLLGYTEEEIDHYFKEALQAYSEEKSCSVQSIKSEMQDWYLGYRFSADEQKVYNPYTILCCLDDQWIATYWFNSDTSTFLIELLSKDPLALYNIEDKGINASSLNFWDNGAIPLITILHQTGYLTIKGSSMFFGTPSYTLDYPNEEVRSSVAPILIALITKKETSGVIDMLKQMKQALSKEDISTFISQLESLFVETARHHKGDNLFLHALCEFLVLGLGFEGESEVTTSNGRIDFVITPNTTRFVFEFELNGET